MSLAFLVPLFLVGLAGIAIPIVVHLTRRHRRNVVAFPSLMFLEKIPYQEQRRRRIQHWLLLAMRAVALALLAVAFARPFLQDAALDASGSGGPREVVVLLDQSYSMSLGTAWETARSEARRAVSNLGPLDRASVVLFSQGAHVVARSTSDPTRLLTAVDTARVGSGTTRYGPALKAAQTILEESGLPGREVVLVSDFQRGGWTGDEGVRLPAGTVVTTRPVQPDMPDNLEVAGLSLIRRTVTGRERVTPTARIVRHGGDAPAQVPVTLALDGQELQTRDVRIGPDGSATVTFDPFTLSQPHTRGTVRVAPDALDADDAMRFVISPGRPISVRIVDGPTAGSGGSLYLRSALETSEEGRFRVSARRGDGVRPADLEGTDVLILDDVRVDGASAARVRDFVTGGGGLLFVAGESASWPTSAPGVLPGSLGAVEDRSEDRGGRLGFLEYGHPVFEVFSGPRSGDFSGARFLRARSLAPDDSVQILARFDDGSVAMAERHLGRGGAAAWMSTLDTYWNDLALQPVFLPFVHRVVEHLSGRTRPAAWFTAGQVLDLGDPDALETAGLASAAAAQLEEGEDQVALTPSGSSLALPAGAGPRYLALDERGFYVIRPPGTEPERPFTVAVNVDPSESNLERMDPRELAAQVVAPGPGPTAGPSFDAAELRREDRERRQSVWRYLLLAAFALLLIETGVSNWMSRRGMGAARVAVE